MENSLSFLSVHELCSDLNISSNLISLKMLKGKHSKSGGVSRLRGSSRKIRVDINLVLLTI